ncbi:hypothetical protein NW765_008517 [Fusarium oxysporum]|nr:hypothetical protein NW765_008517 [Fusarium oxysporum]
MAPNSYMRETMEEATRTFSGLIKRISIPPNTDKPTWLSPGAYNRPMGEVW